MNILFLLVSLRIVTSTSDITLSVKAIAPDEVEVVNIIPPGGCPGHFDLSFEEANLIFGGDLILYHGFESWFGKVGKLRSGLKIIDLETDGNWMIPELYLEGATEIYDILKEEFGSDNRKVERMEQNYRSLKKEIDSLSRFISKKKESFEGLEVICNEYQKDFLEFLGLNVVAFFPAGDELSLRKISEIVKIGKEKNIKIVVDNFQSGRKVGETIAKELKADYVILSNFPDERGYEKTVLDNIEILLEALN